jgi:hypothetical protein
MHSNGQRFFEKLKKDRGLRKKVLDFYQAGDLRAIEKLAAKNACPANFAELSKHFKQFKGELSDAELEIVNAGEGKSGN